VGSSNRWRVCREFFAPFIQKRKEREPVRTGFLFVIIIIVTITKYHYTITIIIIKTDKLFTINNFKK